MLYYGYKLIKKTRYKKIEILYSVTFQEAEDFEQKGSVFKEPKTKTLMECKSNDLRYFYKKIIGKLSQKKTVLFLRF